MSPIAKSVTRISLQEHLSTRQWKYSEWRSATPAIAMLRFLLTALCAATAALVVFQR
jgi:hypothetical protein